MRHNEPQTLDTILDQAASLSQIQERTVALAKLTRIVSELLPHQLNKQCRVANYRQGVLIIEVSSASWSTRLKYEQSNLLSALRQKVLPALSSIQYQINPDIAVDNHHIAREPKHNATIKSTLSPQSADFLYSLAKQAPERLKKQLIKLANHAK